jgi:leucyl/phenylalanyl-tRNA---protein transferase
MSIEGPAENCGTGVMDLRINLKTARHAPPASRSSSLFMCNAPMPRAAQTPDLRWIEADEHLPPAHLAWGAESPAPGLLAASHDLSAARLQASYSEGIFPWFSAGQPVLWWSPDPRMVLHVARFRFHRSLRQTLKRCLRQPGFSLTFDRDFSQVMRRCSASPRPGQSGAWIVPAMVAAYEDLHRAGHAHSAEVWQDGVLVAGLYFVALGHAVFGESMFTTVTDGSKMALASLVSVCLQHGVEAIDCQQNTRHLASLGAQEIPRTDFVAQLKQARQKPPIAWAQQSLSWDALTALDSAA